MTTRRRELLHATALFALAGLAGCAGRQDQPGNMLPQEPDYSGWFDGVSNYKGTEDHRGAARVTVQVGVSGSLGFYKFGPPAVAVSPGTTLVWEWTGKGGPHNVVSTTDEFHSGDLTDRKGATFEYTFEHPGVYRYYCDPHRGMGMKGAVFVALDDE